MLFIGRNDLICTSFRGLKYAVYDSTEGEVEEEEMFWNDLDRVVNRIGICYVC